MKQDRCDRTVLKEALSEVMKKRGYSQAKVARSLGVSATALSQWQSDSYQGDNSRIDEAVSSYLKLQTERMRKTKKAIPFVMTSVAEGVFKAARICHIDGEIGVVYGRSGIGKTSAVKEYASRNKDVILIEADNGYTAKDLFAELVRRCGGYASSSINEMKNEVIDRLKESGRLLIIDEAENLPFKAIDLLRRVNDKGGVGVMFVGINRLYESLISKRTIYSYVLNRIGVAACLEPVTPDDVREIVHKVLPDTSDLWKTFYEMSKGNARTVSKLMARSQALADENGAAITPEIIKEAARELMI